MGTIWIRELTGGLDARKLPETSPGGTLMRAVDGHINRGGEFEQRADFVPTYSLPQGLTKGLARTSTGLVVFGHQALPSGIPAGVTYQRLQHPGGEALRGIKQVTVFGGKLQVVAEFEDGSSYLFFDGARVTDSQAPPNLADSGNPATLLTKDQKMYVGAGPNLFFSGIADSTDFGDGTAVFPGFIAMSSHNEGAEQLVGLAKYDDLVAVFCRRTILTWFFDPDPDLNRIVQELENTGAVASRSITQFGDGDVFYLDTSGVRSLRARDSSNSAATTDIGSPIDPIVANLLANFTDEQAERAAGVIEPLDGRFWLAIGDRILVFSYFTSSKVSAWSEYRPGFDVEDMVLYNDRVWLRSGDTIYVYGGTGKTFSYSDGVGEAWLPYLDADDPARNKTLDGIDAAVRGVWEVRVAMDPDDEGISDVVAVIDRTTYGRERIPADGEFNHVSLRFRAVSPKSATEPAKLSSAIIHFTADSDEEDG